MLQVYELRCGRTGLQYVAPPPPGVPAAALLSAAVSRALGCLLPLPLAPLFDCGEALLETVQDVLLPSRGTPFVQFMSAAPDLLSVLYLLLQKQCHRVRSHKPCSNAYNQP